MTGRPISSAIAFASAAEVGDPAGRAGDVMFGEQLLRLVLEKVHQASLTLAVVSGRRSGELYLQATGTFTRLPDEFGAAPV